MLSMMAALAKWGIMKTLLLLTGVLFLFQNANAFPTIPDPQQTVGQMCTTKDRDFTGYRYAEKIPYCHRNVSDGLKHAIYDSYKIPAKCRGRYTIDHFYPLSMGGNNNRQNLWPEHKMVKALRQDLEQDLFDRMAAGTLKQMNALAQIKEAKLHPPVQNLPPKSDNPCDQVEMIFNIIDQFAGENI